MGNCCTNDFRSQGLAENEVYSREFEFAEDRFIQNPQGKDGTRVRTRGSSKCVSMYTRKGRKGVNQDAMIVCEDFTGEKNMTLCGVFDGHGPVGHIVARYARTTLPLKISAAIKKSQQHRARHYNNDEDDDADNSQIIPFASWESILRKSYNEVDEAIAREINTDSFYSGSTSVTVIKQGDQLIIGNLGDSRAVLCTRGNTGQLFPIQLTVDLKPNIPSEASRIHSCQGRVFAEDEEPDVYRIWMPEEDCPGLAMSRAFGDFCLKDYGLISTPDVFYRKISEQDEFVVLATDGIWDVLTNNEVIDIVASSPKRSQAAKLLVKYAVRAWAHKYPGAKVDDCAAICFFLKDQTYSTPYGSGEQRQYSKKHGMKNEDTNSMDPSETNSECGAPIGLARANTISKIPRHKGNANKRPQSSSWFLEEAESH